MQKLDIKHSLKNIPIESNESFLIRIIEKIESVVNRICWKAHLFLHENHERDTGREDFEFKSKNTSRQCKHMEVFKKKFLAMILDIKFKTSKLNKDTPK